MQKAYEEAYTLYENGDFLKSRRAFADLKGYKDSDEMILECNYELGLQSMKKESYEDAIRYFDVVKKNVEDEDLISQCNKYIKECNTKIEEAEALREAEEWAKALNEAYENKDLDWFIENVDKFKRLSGEQISQMVVGEWYLLSDLGKTFRYDYTADMQVISYDGVSNGQILTYDYEVKEDCLVVIGVKNAVYDLGNGYYLRCNAK